jgi:uncharacterized protein (TIGR03437 family)
MLQVRLLILAVFTLLGLITLSSSTTLAAEPASTSVESAGYQPTTAPGGLMSAFGSGFPTGQTISEQALGLPLPTSLSGIQVCVDGIPSPILAVSVTADGNFQVNYQMPWEVRELRDAGETAPVEVFFLGTRITTHSLPLSAMAPGLFTSNASGTGQAAAQIYNASTREYLPNGPGNPAIAGGLLILYGSGTELTVDSVTREISLPETGDAVPNTPLYVTPTLPTVTVGGRAATVVFSGLTPGFVGLWQINVQLAPDTPTGSAVPIVVNYGDQSTRAGITVAVQGTAQLQAK